MHRLIEAKALRFVALLLLVLAVLPLKADAFRGTADEDPEAEYVRYFPIAFRNAHYPPAPDLVVEAITVNRDSAVVVIKNQGEAAVETWETFWVDLYVDPEPMPTAPNEVWDRLCEQGLVWAISAPALPLEAGETFTMTYCAGQEEADPYYRPEYSEFGADLTPGTRIAVQVDSANVDTTYGGVLEDHEVLGGTYNNISWTLSLAGSGCQAVPTAQAPGRLSLSRTVELPIRVRHAE
jgi:hypothetical protein